MRNLLVFFALLSLQSNAWAKFEAQEADFVGNGLMKSPADFISLEFNVNSQCYQTPQKAQEATDEVVKSIDEYLQTFKQKDDQDFKVLVSGGYTAPFSRWHANREICLNTFQKATTISLNIGASEDFYRIFANMQTHVLEHFAQGYVLDSSSPITFVQISTPEPKIRREHRAELEKEALNLAMLDAKAKFKAATQSCKEHVWKVSRISETGQSFEPRPPRPYMAKMAMMSSSDAVTESAAPVRFDELQVEKALAVTFMFEGAMCYTP